MEYTKLGGSGLKVSRIALGCMSFGDTSRGFSAPIVRATKEHHLSHAAAALDITLTADEIRALEQPYTVRQPTGY